MILFHYNKIIMKKLPLIWIVLLVYGNSFSQVGIGTVNPDTSSVLELFSTNSGLLIPRINLSNVSNAFTPVNSPASGLLVYNTNAAVVGGNGIGFYYWDGNIWTKLFTSIDEKWRRSATGELYPATLTDRIGIGTNTPNAPLQFSNSAVNRKIVLYDTNNNDHQYYGLGINGGTLRYQTDALGADHVFFAGVNSTSSNELMRIKGTGNVGIGTNNPVQKLDISGKIKITDGSQGVGKVLSSDANGVATWVNNIAVTPAVIGVFAGGGASFGNGTPVGTQTAMVYCNVYIDLPAGKWIVFGTYLLAGTTTLTAGQSVFVRTTLSTSNTVSVNADLVSGSLVSGTLNGPGEFGLANGQTIINNTSGITKRYYLWANIQKFGTTPTTFTMAGVGSNFWAENQLSAIPTN